MNNKKIYIIGGVAILVVALAAFFGVRLLNSNVQGLNPFQMMGGNGDMMSFSINVVPAPELPVTQPEVVGLFVSRQDNTLTIQPVPMDGGISQGGGVVITSSGGEGGGSGSSANAPTVEVIVTNETLIYKETTEMGAESPSEDQTVQQTVGEGTLDDLSSQTFITVWGRKNGDRIIAQVLFYSNPVMIQAP